MFYKSLLLLLFIFVSLLNSQELGEDTIVLEANEAPPFWSKGLPHDGMAGEIIYEMSKVAKLKSVIKFKPLSRLIEDDTNNDLGNPSFYINNQDFGAIIPIAIYHVSMYYYAPNHKKKLTFRSIEDLKGFKIGILKGTVVDHAYFQKHGVLFEESYTQEALFRKLKLGRIDMLIEIELVAKQILNNLFSKEKNNFIEIAFLKSSYPIEIGRAHV